MRCLVTGATGFIGRQLVCELIKDGHEILCLSRKPVSPKSSAIEVVVGDLLDADLTKTLEKRARGLEVVIHAGGMLPFSEPSDPGLYMDANATATVRLLDRCLKMNVSRFVYLSSISVVGDPQLLPITEGHPTRPLTTYSLSKLTADLACGHYDHGPMTTMSLRITSPYGIGMHPHTVLPCLVQKALSSTPYGWYGSGKRSQDFVHISDVVAACKLALNSDVCGVINVASGQPVTMKHLATTIAAAVGGASPVQIGQLDPQEGNNWEIDISAAKAIGFSPLVAFEDGLGGYVDAIKYRHEPDRWWC
jgi:UDP-glucose 4-epimerase